MKTCFHYFVALCTTLLLSLAGHLTAAGVQITGTLANFDVRYPNSLPNDFEIVLYGDGLATNDVVETWNSNTLLGGVGVQWGPASSVTSSVNNDPTSPAFGLNCVIVRYAGPPRPALVGQLVHFGVRLRIGATVAHQELWWTINGQRILRPDAPQLIWQATKNGWLIEVSNPTPIPIYIYGTRFFAPAAAPALPTLNQLTTAITPAAFGAADWTGLPLPGGTRVYCLQPWCRTYFRVPGVPLRPVVLQIAARNAPEQILPLPPGTIGPNPNDWNGELGTTAILTTRATQELAEDVNGDGAVGIPDFNLLRNRFGTVSQDIAP